VAVAAVLVLPRAGPAEIGGSETGSGASGLEELDLYYAGLRADGLQLTTVLRRDDTASYASFVYGDCVGSGDLGCAPPAEIQVWPVCRRSLAVHDGAGESRGPVPEWVGVRGVRGAVFEAGRRLELETGRSLIVVFARSRQHVLRMAAELRAVDGSADADAPLPPPGAHAAGEEGGAMAC
jgi:hypothetical protein